MPDELEPNGTFTGFFIWKKMDANTLVRDWRRPKRGRQQWTDQQKRQTGFASVEAAQDALRRSGLDLSDFLILNEEQVPE